MFAFAVSVICFSEEKSSNPSSNLVLLTDAPGQSIY